MERYAGCADNIHQWQSEEVRRGGREGARCTNGGVHDTNEWRAQRIILALDPKASQKVRVHTPLRQGIVLASNYGDAG